MNRENFTHYRVFTNSPEALQQASDSPKALGNKASVVFLDTLPTEVECLKHMQTLAETTGVFIAPNQNDRGKHQHFDITWYNTQQRIQRCGHGTLAAAHLLSKTKKVNRPLIFHSVNEQLVVTFEQGTYSLQFNEIHLVDSNNIVIANATRSATTAAHDGYYLIELGSESAVNHFTLTDEVIDSIEQRALIITSLSDNPQYDIVFRYFAPQYGVVEDQATGSAGPCLWAFWQNHLSSQTLHCYQASTRGGFFMLSKPADSVIVSGYVTEK